jgi:hypothetical protein
MGVSLLAHAGLAVGLTIAISRRMPELAPAVVTIVLSAVVVYEIFGPLGVRLAIQSSGETGRKQEDQSLALE